MLFRCPEGMHFNSDLQVCTWPWQGGCDSSRIVCPRPFPQCPIHYSDPLLLPHPFLCDRFYQCNWGMLRLQMCPTGLHFDPHLKVCNWPYNSNCQSCWDRKEKHGALFFKLILEVLKIKKIRSWPMCLSKKDKRNKKAFLYINIINVSIFLVMYCNDL